MNTEEQTIAHRRIILEIQRKANRRLAIALSILGIAVILQAIALGAAIARHLILR